MSEDDKKKLNETIKELLLDGYTKNQIVMAVMEMQYKLGGLK